MKTNQGLFVYGCRGMGTFHCFQSIPPHTHFLCYTICLLNINLSVRSTRKLTLKDTLFAFAKLASCMLVCLYACMLVCLYACMLVCLYACMCVCLYAGMCVCLYACMLVCLYACMLVCLYACMCVC